MRVIFFFFSRDDFIESMVLGYRERARLNGY
jgi:hypothetical protein